MAARGPARAGRKNPALLAPGPGADEARKTAVFVCGARPLLVGPRTLHEGVEVPGAAEWPRIEAWVNARRVRELREGEDFTSYEDFCAQWDAEHPEPEPEPTEDAKQQPETDQVQSQDAPAEDTTTEE